jgi:hypothetical protein
MNKIDMLTAVEISSKYSTEMLFMAFCASAAVSARDFTEDMLKEKDFLSGPLTRGDLKEQAHLFVTEIATDMIADEIDDNYLDRMKDWDLEELAKCATSMLIDNISSLRTVAMDVPVVKREIVEL